jgi:solute carrier family 25 protein 34/35
MYNQPTVLGPNGKMVGTLYKNPIDCLWKTAKAEGLRGWYKGMYRGSSPQLNFNNHLGSTAHFLRIAPHTFVST